MSRLSEVVIRFSEPVTGVDATDLRINGLPALGVTGQANGPYVFRLPEVGPGPVSVAFADDHGIVDEGLRPQAFAGSGWSLTVDHDRPVPAVRIHEVLFSNADGLADEDGERSGWIELHNPGDEPVALGGFSLSDDPDDPGQWVLPDGVLAPGVFLVVFGSGKDRRDPAPVRRLHTGFRLARSWEHLGLYDD